MCPKLSKVPTIFGKTIRGLGRPTELLDAVMSFDFSKKDELVDACRLKVFLFQQDFFVKPLPKAEYGNHLFYL